MALSIDPSALSLDDELESFPQRTITGRRPQQNQRVQRIMDAKDSTLNPILTPSALVKLKKFQLTLTLLVNALIFFFCNRYLPVGTWAVCSYQFLS